MDDDVDLGVDRASWMAAASENAASSGAGA